MGYTTDFYGSFKFNKKVTSGLKKFINDFSNSRRMGRDVSAIKQLDLDWEKNCFYGDLGPDGSYYTGDNDFGVKQVNTPPKGQPGLWCQWIIDNNDCLAWNGAEKFYNYIEWLKYLIENFFIPEDYILNGEVEYQGESRDDFGLITVTNNKVNVKKGVRSYESDTNDTNDNHDEDIWLSVDIKHTKEDIKTFITNSLSQDIQNRLSDIDYTNIAFEVQDILSNSDEYADIFHKAIKEAVLDYIF